MKEQLHQEWHCLLLVYADLSPIGKIVTKRRIGVIRRKLTLLNK